MIGKMLLVYGKEEHFVQKYLHQKMKPKGKMSSNLKKEVVNSVDNNRKDVKTNGKVQIYI
jgi:hypothetical protein